jgi:aminoglycoside/choline kinase family phosphotransferase
MTLDTRQLALLKWLESTGILPQFSLEKLVDDASFRRYFRVRTATHSYVAMDAPPEREKVLPFMHIAAGLREVGIHAPEVFAHSEAEGFLLLSDFGDRQLLQALTQDNARVLYEAPLQVLATLQKTSVMPDLSLPVFTADLMLTECNLFSEWFLVRHLGLSLSPKVHTMLTVFYQTLVDAIVTQPYRFMHRDYHAANLMVLDDGQVGVLDFQDAFIGPYTYDAASLLRDCYFKASYTTVKDCVSHFAELIDVSDTKLFFKQFEWMGLQRHMKAILTFARKKHRDDNPHYLQHIPLALEYIGAVTNVYPEFADFNNYLHASILPAMREPACVQ